MKDIYSKSNAGNYVFKMYNYAINMHYFSPCQRFKNSNEIRREYEKNTTPTLETVLHNYTF